MKVKIGNKTNDIIKRDKKVILTVTRETYPLIPDHIEGEYVCDVEGNKFIDFSSFISVYNLGLNSNREIREAIKKQVDKLMHPAFADFYNELPVRFAEKLVRMAPPGFKGKVFFSNSGTEAVEAAIKFSKIFTRRPYLMAFYGGFHGRTLGSLSLTASKIVQKEAFGPFSASVHAPYAYCYRCPLHLEYPSCGIACADYIRKYPLAKEVSKKELAAIVMEPIQGEGGYVVPPKEFVKEVRKIADDAGAVLVSDEVQAGYMRTGKFFAMDNFGVQADIYTMAKSIGGGVPMGATLVRGSLGDIPAGSHSTTFGGNLLAIAGAEASLDYINKNMPSLQTGIIKKGAYVMKRLEEMKDKYEIIGDVRGLGLMIGVEFVRDRKTKDPAVTEKDEIADDCFENGLIVLPAGMSCIRIIPPLTIDDRVLASGMDLFEEAVKKADAKLHKK
jgi:4-aminobutyrate aminotransferase